MLEAEAKVLEQRKRAAHADRLPPVPTTGPKMAWKFQAYRDLLWELGHGDGMAEVIEVATREFLDAARKTGNPRDYLILRSREQGIVVDELDMDSLPARAATLYIVGAFQQLEGFLADLVDQSDEVRDRRSRSRNNGESSLDWTLDMLPGGRARNVRRIGRERYALLEYYRGVRNAFMHPSKKAASLEGRSRRPAGTGNSSLPTSSFPRRMDLDN